MRTVWLLTTPDWFTKINIVFIGERTGTGTDGTADQCTTDSTAADQRTTDRTHTGTNGTAAQGAVRFGITAGRKSDRSCSEKGERRMFHDRFLSVVITHSR